MVELDDSFAKLLGRQPSDSERQNLYRVRDALGLENNDAIWLILMALEHYKTQYVEFPALIAKTTSSTLDRVQETADNVLKASAEKTKKDLTEAVAKAARDIANNTAKKSFIEWSLIGFTLALILAAVLFWFATGKCREVGYAQGYGDAMAKAQDEKLAASWANTPEGQAAYRLAKSGELMKLTNCTNDGWTIEKRNRGNFCFPRPNKNNESVGWLLP